MSNYVASIGALIVALSPAAPGCVSSVNGVSGAITFKTGTFGFTDANFNSLLASILTAYTSGKPVQIYYDDTTGCPGILIANGGYGVVCP